MKQFLKVDEWNIIEEGFHPDNMRASESIFSLGNGRFGQRGNFEETYSSDSLQGSYVCLRMISVRCAHGQASET